MTRLPVELVKQVISSSLASYGLSKQHVSWMGKGLLGPSLRGIDSHGIRLLETYLNELQGGRSKAKPSLDMQSSTVATATLNAGQSLGIVAGYEATNQAIAMASKCGIAAIAVKNSNHFGAASNYTLEAAKQGLMCLSFSNSDALVAPHGGSEKIFGTNPISFAAPANNNEIFCLDMATSQVSYSKILNCLAQDLTVEPSWAVGVDNNNKSIGALLPLGGYKGQGLAMMVSILSGLLSEGPNDMDMSHLYCEPFSEPRMVGHFIIAIRIDAFTKSSGFRERLSNLMQRVRQSRSVTEDAIIVAGDHEKQTQKQREKDGIPVTPELARFFDQLATKHNLLELS